MAERARLTRAVARSLLTSLIALALLTGCGSPPRARSEAPRPAHAQAQSAVTISIIGLNDLHGRLRALPIYAGYVKNLRRVRAEDGGAVLVVDAGDMFQGTLESNIVEGLAEIEAYNALQVDAVALGNHEFDFGPGGVELAQGTASAARTDPQGAIKARISSARFQMLSANLLNAKTGRPVTWPRLAPSALLEKAGIRLGLIGVLTSDTPRIVMPRFFEGLAVGPLDLAIEREARALRERGADAIVVLAHAGAECQRFDDAHDLSSCDQGEIFEVARRLPKGLVDVIFAGHTHAGVAHFVNGIAIVEAYAYGRAFARADLIVDPRTRRVQQVRPFRPHPLCPGPSSDACAPGSYYGLEVQLDAFVESAMQFAFERVADVSARKLGVTIETPILRAHKRESALGNLFVDLMREAVPNADAAIGNGGSLRTDLPAGELTYGALYRAMPFDNRLVTLKVSGAELRRVFERHLANDLHGIASISGLRIEARCAGSRLELALVRPNGRGVADNEELTLVTSDYLATGGDGLLSGIVPRERMTSVDLLVRDALAAGLERRNRVRGDDPGTYDLRTPRLLLPAWKRPIACSK